MPWVSAIWKAESFGFKVSHASVVVAVEQCKKCVPMRVVFDPAAETKSYASKQCYQGYVHVWAGLMPIFNAHFEVKTIREDYQCLFFSELIDLVQLRHQRHGYWLQISLIRDSVGKSVERSPRIKHGV